MFFVESLFYSDRCERAGENGLCEVFVMTCSSSNQGMHQLVLESRLAERLECTIILP